MTIDERLDRLVERHEALTQNVELLEERQIAAEERQAAAEERHNREMGEIRGVLRHAVALSVREARNERKRRRELDEKITQLAASQLVTEEQLRELKETVRQLSVTWDAFIESLRRGGNGNLPPAPAS